MRTATFSPRCDSLTELRLGNREYKGEVCGSKIEAEVSAARIFWEDPRVQERAEKLEPSKKARKNKRRCAERNAERKARRYGTGNA